MSFKTQKRLASITGTLDDSGNKLSSLDVGDLQGVLDAVASATKRITGFGSFFAADPGHFSQNLHLTASGIDFNQSAAVQAAGASSKLTLAAGSSDNDAISITAKTSFSQPVIFNNTVEFKGATTVSSSNLEITDAIILLGSGNIANVKDLGLIFERGGSNIALFLDETDDVVKFNYTAETATDDEITAAAGKLSVQVDKLQFTGSNYYIEAVDLGTGDVDLTINSSEGIALMSSDATTAKVYFGASAIQTNTIGMTLDLSTDREVAFQDDGNNIHMILDGASVLTKFKQTIRMDTNKSVQFRDQNVDFNSPASGELVGNFSQYIALSGSVYVDNANGTDSGELYIKKNGITSVIKTAATSNSTFVLPDGNGTNGYVLQTDGSGNTSWAIQGASSNSQKQSGTVDGIIAANNVVFFSSGSGGQFTEATTALDVSAVLATNRKKSVDVYVNGSLVFSGTSAPASNVSGGDYTLIDVAIAGQDSSTTDTGIKFAFELAVDDTVSAIVRV